jgi:hypothetical protein
MPRLRLAILLIFGLAFVVLAMLFVASLGQLYPGNPVVAVLMGVSVLAIGLLAVRAVLAGRREPGEDVGPEDVTGLEVFLVCGECGTEFRVEKIGQLQIPRHCGEQMQVIQRPSETAWPGA